MHPDLQSLLNRVPALEGCGAQIEGAYSLLRNCFASKHKLLVCGNGGSAADAEHIVGELMKGFTRPRRLPEALRGQLESEWGLDGVRLAAGLEGALPAISLVSQLSLVSAIVNDGAPDLIYAQQVLGYGAPGDVLLAISTSGNSRNVLHALQIARSLGLSTIGLTGKSGGAMASCCDIAICCPSASTPEIQEYHLPIYHTLCIMLESEFFPD